MQEPDFVRTLSDALGNKLLAIAMQSPGRWFAEVEGADGHLGAVKHLTETYRARLMTISAVDLPAYYELLYHMDVGGQVVTVRARVWKPGESILSVASVNPAAELIEHEITELFGVEFEGNPREVNMLLDDETQKGFTPLRARVGQLDARVDGNMESILEHGSTTAPSRRVMKAREKLGMEANPPLCSLACQDPGIIYRIAEATGAVSNHPNLRKKEVDE